MYIARVRVSVRRGCGDEQRQNTWLEHPRGSRMLRIVKLLLILTAFHENVSAVGFELAYWLQAVTCTLVQNDVHSFCSPGQTTTASVTRHLLRARTCCPIFRSSLRRDHRRSPLLCHGLLSAYALCCASRKRSVVPGEQYDSVWCTVWCLYYPFPSSCLLSSRTARLY